MNDYPPTSLHSDRLLLRSRCWNELVMNEFKYEIGQYVFRFGAKVIIADRSISPLGNNVYQVKEVYKGNLETVSAREDELRSL